MRRILFLTIILLLTFSGLCIAQMTSEEQAEYDRLISERDTTIQDYNNYREQFWAVMGTLLEDDGDVVYIYGTYTQATIAGQGGVNIKVLNPPRKLVTYGAYNGGSDMMENYHRYVRQEVTYNSWGQPLPLYVFEYVPYANTEISRLYQRLSDFDNQAKSIKAQRDKLDAAENRRLQAEKKQAYELDLINNHSPYEAGVYFFVQKDYDKAAEFFNKEIASNPLNTLSYYWMGILHHKSGDYNKAISMYSLALGEIGDLVKDASKEDKDAFKKHAEALILNNNEKITQDDIYLKRGHLYARTGNLKQGRKDMRKAYELGQSNDEKWQLALICDVSGMWSDAQIYYEDIDKDMSSLISGGDKSDRNYERMNHAYGRAKYYRSRQTGSMVTTERIPMSDYLRLSKWSWEPT